MGPVSWAYLFPSFALGEIENMSTIQKNRPCSKLIIVSGFRRNHNCETTLLRLIQDFHDCPNKKEIVGMVSKDFRKAFDLPNQSIPLRKLSSKSPDKT